MQRQIAVVEFIGHNGHAVIDSFLKEQKIAQASVLWNQLAGKVLFFHHFRIQAGI